MDELVQRFPNDYRAYALRGLYYGLFAQLNRDSLKPALENLRKAGEVATTSALPHFFRAHVLRRTYLIEELGMSDKQRAELQLALLNELTAALSLDPYLFPALTSRAEVYFELKQFQQAISDYDKILAIDPKYAGAYNDRALAKMELGDHYGAIADFAYAIANKKRDFPSDRRSRSFNQHKAIPRALSRIQRSLRRSSCSQTQPDFFPEDQV